MCQRGPAQLTLTTQPQRRLTFHNHRSPHAKTSHITYVGTASLMTGASGADEGEARANWGFRRACARLTVARAACLAAEAAPFA